MDDRVTIIGVETLARGWGTLSATTIHYRRKDGTVQRFTREVYDHGNAAAMLLVDPARQTVLLVRQFRFPPTLNGDAADLLEACAGLLDDENPEVAARREALEETGHEPVAVRHLFDIYPSPGSLSEKTSLFIGEYGPETLRHPGGGLIEEGEEIELVELGLDDALAMVADGRITDAKTIILLQHLAIERLSAR